MSRTLIPFSSKLTFNGFSVMAAASLVLLTAAAAAATHTSWRTTEKVVTPPTTLARAPETAQSAAASSSSNALPGVRVTIRPTGFDPTELTLPQGRFVLTVDNRSGLRELTFRINSESGARLQEVTMPREKLNWRGIINPAGSYVITETAHPDWQCRVTITAQ